jgi:hypothetical protein
MTPQFETKDSGKREEFGSGMVRDTQEGKLRFDLAFDGPLADVVFGLLSVADGDLILAFNQWYQTDSIEDGAAVIARISAREGGLLALFERYAGLMTRGAQKYSARNWMKAAGQAELERFKASAARHFMQYLRGDRDEDHAAAVYFNINGAHYVLSKLEAQL